jgi:hypothetical protein
MRPSGSMNAAIRQYFGVFADKPIRLVCLIAEVLLSILAVFAARVEKVCVELF